MMEHMRMDHCGMKRPRSDAQNQQDDVVPTQASKKPRRSARINGHTPTSQAFNIPSPITSYNESIGSRRENSSLDQREDDVKHTATEHHSPHRQATMSPPPTPAEESTENGVDGLSFPESNLADSIEEAADSQNQTQPFTQPLEDIRGLGGVQDEEKEGVWGYLIELQGENKTIVLKDRTACAGRDDELNLGHGNKSRLTDGRDPKEQEEQFEQKKTCCTPAGGYLIGRSDECDISVDKPYVSQRHCIIFKETRKNTFVAVLEDTSTNGTMINNIRLARNRRLDIEDGQEISVGKASHYIFRYASTHHVSDFHQKYQILQRLGRGHFASVFVCIEKATGSRWAVKRFDRPPGWRYDKSKEDALEQEIAVLASLSHPNMICYKEAFQDEEAVHVIVELAAEGELFNWIVKYKKLTEDETRRVYLQLLQGLKYLHDRDIIHRDIKPENILLVDRQLSLKYADFGLSKFVGEDSFTTSLCGTPAYVAPEILVKDGIRRYNRAIDMWSLGVVLYICLCGFPPFSEDIHYPDLKNMRAAIVSGTYTYPRPYWNSISKKAMNLVDRMLTVDPAKRITVDEALQHPFMTNKEFHSQDSTDGLADGIEGLDFSKRMPERQRTLLADMVSVDEQKCFTENMRHNPVKIFEKHFRNEQVAGEQAGKMDDELARGEKRAKEADKEEGLMSGEAEEQAELGNKRMKMVNEDRKQHGAGEVKEDHATTESRDVGLFMDMGEKGDPALFDPEEGEGGTISEDEEPVETKAK